MYMAWLRAPRRSVVLQRVQDDDCFVYELQGDLPAVPADRGFCLD